ncbi:MAG: DEAD/DEAH box helicase, partial [Acidimicrobiales bacterium]
MTTVSDPPDRALEELPVADPADAETEAALPPTSFADLGVDPVLVEALTDQGITKPFPIQAMTTADGLSGRDVCGKAKTGSGKTLAFGVPLLQRTMASPSTVPGRPRA